MKPFHNAHLCYHVIIVGSVSKIMNKPEESNTLVNNMQEHYKTIIELMPGHVYWKDKQGRYVGCNLQRAVDAGCHSPEEMTGCSDDDVSWENQADYLRAVDEEVMDTNKTKIIDEVFQLPDGTKKLYVSSKRPLLDQNNYVVGILGVSFDVTEREKLEEDIIKIKEKAANTINALTTESSENTPCTLSLPITSIIHCCDLILKALHGPKKLEEFTESFQEAFHALSFIHRHFLETEFAITGKVIDLLSGAEYLNTTEEKVWEMTMLFYSKLDQDMALIETAHESKDWETVQNLVHKMKGAACYIGTPRLKQACTHYEKSIKMHKIALYERLHQQFLHEIDMFKAMYLSMVK